MAGQAFATRGCRSRIHQVEARIVRSYYVVQLQRRRVDLEARLLESARLTLEATEDCSVSMRRTRSTSSAPEMAVAEPEGRIHCVQGDIRRARLPLADAIGLPGEIALDLDDLRDPRDDMVLESAVKAGCEWIVTFNHRDFAGSCRFDVRAIAPGEFLRKI